MKLYKKAILGFTALALLGGGLAGCGKSASSQQGQKSESAKNASSESFNRKISAENKQDAETEAKENTVSQIANKDIPSQYTDHNYPDEVKNGFLFDHNEVFTGSDLIIQVENYPSSRSKQIAKTNMTTSQAKTFARKMWAGLHRNIIKHGHSKMKPVTIHFDFMRTGDPEAPHDKNVNVSTLYQVKSNQSTLHGVNKPVVKNGKTVSNS